MNVKKITLTVMVLILTLAMVFAGGSKETASTMNMSDIKLQPSNNPSGKLEIFSWWAGDEGPALEALIKVFERKYPSVDLINATVTGGSGVNAKAVLKTRMLGGEPPEAFQAHAGMELIGTWVVADKMMDLTPIFEKEDLLNKFPETLIPLLSKDGGIWAMPVCVHKSNVMWYIPENLKKWGVDVPRNFDEFIMVCDKLKSKGIIPLSMGTTWTANENWENVALGVLGPDDYNKLWNGELRFDNPKVVNVWETFAKVISYTNTDAASLSWQQATDMVINGKAAFNWMGDWAAGYMMTTKKLKAGTGFGWTNTPGTRGVFQFLSDSFGVPKGCKNPEAAAAWVATCGSKEGQDAFNPLKGSIPARIDADMSLYSEYSKSAAKDFSKDIIVGSLAHGCVASEGFANDFSKVMETFLNNKDATNASLMCQELADKYIR